VLGFVGVAVAAFLANLFQAGFFGVAGGGKIATIFCPFNGVVLSDF
jgi:hypothetical protein